MLRIDAHDSKGVGVICLVCRSGGTGRRTGLKIPWVVIPVPVRFRSAALVKDGRNVGFTMFLLFFCFKKVEPLMGCWLMEKHEQGNKFQILEKL